MTNAEIIALWDAQCGAPGLHIVNFARALIAATRREVIKDAARICDRYSEGCGGIEQAFVATECANDIRALATDTTGGEPNDL